MEIKAQRLKVAVITCYFDPDYVRARTIRAGLKNNPRVEMIVVKNKHKGMARYAEMFVRLWQLKFKQKPDVYLLTFRGQEILPLVLLVAGRKKPVIFDEFIVPGAYANKEPHKRSFAIMVKHGLARVSGPLYRWWLKRCRIILADTQAHAELSASTNQTNLRMYRPLPVGADEDVFKPARLGQTSQMPQLSTAADTGRTTFQVFYYGNMLPLHGVPLVIEAAERLATNPNISFLIVGGKQPVVDLVQKAIKNGANIEYKKWIPFDELPKNIYESGLCLGGPFGNTFQAQHVITGKTYQFLACGAPVLIGKNQASELFVDKQNALVVPQGDVVSLRNAIEWAAANPKELEAIAARGRALYEKHFSNAAISEQLARLIDEVA